MPTDLQNIQKVYLNDVQRDIATVVQAKDTILVAGRAFGKGMVHALWNLRNFQRMPGSITGFVSANIKRALTNTLPSMLVHWEKWGYQRNKHWCIGIKPPKAWGWAKPIFPVQNFENVISFYNGSIGYIISQDRSGTSNSQSYDALDCDEAKFIDFEQFKDETLPALRGNRNYFGKRFYHHSMLISSDMPVTRKGSWFLDYREKCDPEVIQVIRGLACEIAIAEKRVREFTAAGQQPPPYIRKHLRSMHRDLCQLRAVAVDYREVSTIENLHVLGEAFIKQLKRDLPPLTFQTSVLCKRIGLSRDGFYSSMTDKHKYSATNFSYLDSLEYKFDKIKEPSSLMDADVDPMRPLCVAFDYNTNINWMVVGQPKANRLLVLKSFYVKYERKLRELVADFCQYYRHHKNKRVVFYFDATAKQGSYAVDGVTFLSVIHDTFRANGWAVTLKDIGKPMGQQPKHLLINRMFAGQGKLIPMFNRENNEDLLISVQSAGVYNGGKDKRGEKLAESDESKLEFRTDGSDAFDTLCIGCETYPVSSSMVSVVSSF
ncbi:MAG: hypothetical protein NC248_11455 [Bacteroides sp.]|nr:hypothetical protein [Bacteroides sp.]MCM1391031.1 hypothetical protein [Bacteroides sp.]